MAQFIDTHAHVDDPVYQAELDQVLERARAAGVERIITVGTDQESSEVCIRLSERFGFVYAVVGWHPNNAVHAPADVRSDLARLARHPKVVAIGETGLDHYRLPSLKKTPADEIERIKKRQVELFQQQLEVASDMGLNCVVHQRGEVMDHTMACLQPYTGRLRAVFHCFPGDVAALRRIQSIGGLVSFTGILTFKNGENVRQALAAADMNGFMLETDCPYLAPEPYRGKRCDPEHLIETARVAAQVKGCTLDELAAATNATAETFFARLKSA